MLILSLFSLSKEEAEILIEAFQATLKCCRAYHCDKCPLLDSVLCNIFNTADDGEKVTAEKLRGTHEIPVANYVLSFGEEKVKNVRK